MKGEITDTKEVQRIVTIYYELYANKLVSLDKMDKFLETYNVQKLYQEESENLNRQITLNETEAVIKRLPTNKIPVQHFYLQCLLPHKGNIVIAVVGVSLEYS